MKIIYIPGCISCIDELISPWTIWCTFPSWIFYTRKTHPYGNENHYISDKFSVIIFSIDLVEWKDRSIHIGRKGFHEEVGTSPLLLRLTNSLFGTGNIIILYICFCVLESIVSLKKRGVYSSALIKNVTIGTNILMGPAFKPSWTTNMLGIKRVFLKRYTVLDLFYLPWRRLTITWWLCPHMDSW